MSTMTCILMGTSGTIDADVNSVLWTAGWYWIFTIIGVAIAAIAFGVVVGGVAGWLIGFFGVFASPLVGLGCLFYVRSNLSAVEEQAMATIRSKASDAARLREDHDRFSLKMAEGNSQLFLPSPERSITTLLAGESLLLVHDAASADLRSLSWSVGESTNEYYYDQISGVNYKPDENRKGGTFWVNLSDGHGQSWETSGEPNDALRTVQDRVREYKRAASV